MGTIRPPNTPAGKVALVLILSCLVFQFFATKYHLEVPSYVGMIVMTALALLSPQVFAWVSDYKRMPMQSSSGFGEDERNTEPQGRKVISDRPSTDPQSPQGKRK